MTNFGFISLDIIIVLVVIFVLIAISFRAGKKPLTSLSLSAYPTLLIFEFLPFVNLTDATARALAFLVIYVLVNLIVWKIIHVKKIHSFGRKIVDYVLLSASFVVLLISIELNSVPDLLSFYQFSPLLTDWISQIPYGIALAIPFAVFLVTNRNDL